MAQPDHIDNVAQGVELTEKPAQSSSSGPLKVGQLVDAKYEILELIGTGGMSSVYKARQIFTKQIVALKVLSPTIASRQDSVQRFRHEARATARLNHPGIVRMYDFDVVDGLPYLTMDFVEGKSLSALIKDNQGLPPKRVIPMFTQLCDALAHAHTEGILHRDLKPSNVIVSAVDGRDIVKIVDFGIAKMETEDTQGLTRTGEVFGSPFYMSPEQCQGLKLDARSDIYSLGCMLFESLTGQPPFQGSNIYATIRMQMEEAPVSFRSCKRSLFGPLADQLQSITFRAMQKAPNDRFQSMNQLSEALNKSQTASPLEALLSNVLGQTRVKRKSHPYRLPLVMLLALLMFTAIGTLIVALKSPGAITEWMDRVNELVKSPSASPAERWEFAMTAGMNDLNYCRFGNAETNLKNALLISKQLPERKHELMTLKQLRVLYQIENKSELQSAIDEQIARLPGGKKEKSDDDRKLLEQTIALLPEHPDQEQIERIHSIITNTISLAQQYQLQTDLSEARGLLKMLMQKVDGILKPDDAVLTSLHVQWSWLNLDALEAQRLLQSAKLKPSQLAILHFVLGWRDFHERSLTEANDEVKKVLSLVDKQNQKNLVARAHELEARIAHAQDDNVHAERAYKAAIAEFKLQGNPSSAAWCIEEQARALVMCNRATDADRVVRDELSEVNVHNREERILAARCYEMLSFINGEMGKNYFSEARKAVELAQSSMEADSPDYKNLLLYSAGELATSGNFDSVLGLSRQLAAIAEMNKLLDKPLYDESRDLMSCSYFALNQQAQAKTTIDKRLADYISGPPDEPLNANEWFVDACTKIASKQQAVQVINKLSKSIDSAVDNSKPPGQVVVEMRWLARLCWQINDQPGAFQTYERAIKYLSTHQVSGGIEFGILYDYGVCLQQAGAQPEAKRIWQAATDARHGKKPKLSDPNG